MKKISGLNFGDFSTVFFFLKESGHRQASLVFASKSLSAYIYFAASEVQATSK